MIIFNVDYAVGFSVKRNCERVQAKDKKNLLVLLQLNSPLFSLFNVGKLSISVYWTVSPWLGVRKTTTNDALAGAEEKLENIVC
jgi:hypothetical protein